MAFGGILKLVETLKAATAILFVVILWYAEFLWERVVLLSIKMPITSLSTHNHPPHEKESSIIFFHLHH